jgi:hypothetical protein
MADLAARKLITCFLPRGKGAEVARLLNSERGINAADVTSGRGRALVDAVSYGEWVEVDILTVMVDEAEADEIFEFVYHGGELGRLHGGLMYQTTLLKATSYSLPDGAVEEGS